LLIIDKKIDLETKESPLKITPQKVDDLAHSNDLNDELNSPKHKSLNISNKSSPFSEKKFTTEELLKQALEDIKTQHQLASLEASKTNKEIEIIDSKINNEAESDKIEEIGTSTHPILLSQETPKEIEIQSELIQEDIINLEKENIEKKVKEELPEETDFQEEKNSLTFEKPEFEQEKEVFGISFENQAENRESPFEDENNQDIKIDLENLDEEGNKEELKLSDNEQGLISEPIDYLFDNLNQETKKEIEGLENTQPEDEIKEKDLNPIEYILST